MGPVPCLLLLAAAATARPQTFSLSIGFGSDSAPLTFHPAGATPAPAPPRSAPAPPHQAALPPLPTRPSGRRQPPAAPLQGSTHAEALQRNALARSQLAEVVAQHNQRTAAEADSLGRFSQSLPQQNHFQRVGPACLFDCSTGVPGPKAQKSPVPVSHDQALRQNALHRQQLAAVVAKHSDIVDSASMIMITQSTEGPVKVPKAPKFEQFLSKKAKLTPPTTSTAPTTTTAPTTHTTPTTPTTPTTTTHSQQPSSKADAKKQAGEENDLSGLEEHLSLLSELDRQVEELFNQALVVFSAEQLK